MMILIETGHLRHERNYTSRRLRNTIASDHIIGEQAIDARLRQADDLLSAVNPNERRHSRNFDYFYAKRPSAF